MPPLPDFCPPLPTPALPPLGLRPQRLELLGPGHAGRLHAEAFVRQAFARRYGARVGELLPHLVCLVDAGGGLCAAAGVRWAGEGALFLEQYLDRPVEEFFPADGGDAVARKDIVEIGNLAVLRNHFERMGLAPMVLGRADPVRLGPEAARWGRYYDEAPHVIGSALRPTCWPRASPGPAARSRRFGATPGG
ncbi:MAG: hypothetical protein GWO16_03610 [Gammaproteobacteria bacterium]|nr:hypothetical protein [Gammaproteobacteria bacterium]NIR97695.1 hypothetical protein [Gammaproteobacteria bacterium]NIT62888.1 hypothetical protein [Gammaproteobacteria bacterium]NIV19853.1 hypothetical protein [Gammaproteobacteria bacterium]NIX11366.1 hypothetical protein [Gammaproteobacteria bacterium]